MLVNPVNQEADIALDDIQRQRQRERAAYHYFRAMEEGDLDTVVLMLERAESDPVLEHMLLDLDAHLVEEAEERERAGSRSPLADPPAPTQPMLALLAPETMGDAGQTRAESCVSSDGAVVEWQELLQQILLLYTGHRVEHRLSSDKPVDAGTLMAEVEALAARAWEAPQPPRASSSKALTSSLYLPDARWWASEPDYSRSVARALVRAYAALARAPGLLRAYADAYAALEDLVDWELCPMSARQRMCVDFVLGMCYAAIGEHVTALTYLDDAYQGARHLGDWGGAAECAHLYALICGALDACSSAADYFSMCLDCLDHL